VVAVLLACAACSGDEGGDAPVLPVVTTGGASTVSEIAEAVAGSIHPNGTETEYWFEWGMDEALTSFMAMPVNVLPPSSTEQAVSGTLSGLPRGTKIYYRLCARNADGEVEGEVKACYHYANAVFVTSARGTGNLGSWPEAGGASGLGAGDAICETVAHAAGLTGAFRPWLSDSTEAATARLVHSAEAYLRVDGVRVASSWSAMTNAACVAGTGWCFEHPIEIDERGGPAGFVLVHTDTLENGAKGSGTNACANWTSASSSDTEYVGSAASPNWAWTANATASCAVSRPLYCFQQNPDLPREP
jgi:hypothetical protein